MVDKNLASKIINLREEIDMTQTELARRLGLDKSAMSKVEKGTRKVSSDELSKLSEIFDVSTDYLLGKTKKPHISHQKHDIVYFIVYFHVLSTYVGLFILAKDALQTLY